MFVHQDRKKCTPEILSIINETEHTPFMLLKLANELQDVSTAELSTYQLLNHTEWKRILYGIFRLLHHENYKIGGNAAFIIASICKYDVGKTRITDIIVDHPNDDTEKMLASFNKLLAWEQDECILNALGSIATIADTSAGRTWLLRKFELDETMETICKLQFLQSTHPNIASNTSLFIARLTIEEEGCARILNTKQRKMILLHLIECLLQTHPNCAMNAAFALGRLFQLESCQRSLLLMKQADNMEKGTSQDADIKNQIQNLMDLVFCEDKGCRKNSSFALQSIASAPQGCQKLLKSERIDQLFHRLIELLSDDTIGMFSIYFLQSIVYHSEGCIYLRDHSSLKSSLFASLKGDGLSKNVKTELKVVVEYLADLPKPSAPRIKVEGATSLTIQWDVFQHKNGLPILYHLYQGDTEIYVGDEILQGVSALKPTCSYQFSLTYTSEGATGPLSDQVSITMPESVPTAPTNFHVAHRSTSQLKVIWEDPTEWNGEVKGYILSHNLGGRETKDIELSEKCYLFINLQADTEYTFLVSACTCKGRGPPAKLTASTNSLSMYAPSKPIARILGRTEINIQWEAPHYPLGRLNYYDLRMNEKVIYRGIDRSYTARRLTPGKEYKFKVSAWTSEGRCESEQTSRRTPRQNCKETSYICDRPREKGTLQDVDVKIQTG